MPDRAPGAGVSAGIRPPSSGAGCGGAGVGSWLLGFAVAFGLPAMAQAQSGSYFSRNDNVGVLERARPDYQALGVQAGAFTIFPSLTVAPEYDDNIYAVETGKESDLVTAIDPSVAIRSNWSRNEVEATAQLESNVYATHSTENTTDYQLNGGGRLDILSQSNVSGNVSYSHNTQPRTAENTINTSTTPIQYDQASVNLSGLQTLNRLQFSQQFSYQHTAYSNTTQFNGAPLALSTSDFNAFFLTGRADYGLTPEVALFVSGQFNDRPYDSSQAPGYLDRSSTGGEVTVGTDFDITRLIRGQIQVGYLEQNYSSPLYHQVSGPAAHARIEYFLNGLTTLTATLDRNVVDAVDPLAISFLQTQAGFQVDHELLRNVILSARLNFENDKYTGYQRTDNRPSAALSGTYLLNRHIGVTAGYSYLKQGSSGDARVGNYVVNVVSLSLVFQL